MADSTSFDPHKGFDPYHVLGVTEDDDPVLIRQAYRVLALQHHPDKGGTKEKFQEIAAAYELIGDPDTKKRFDQRKRSGYFEERGVFSGTSDCDSDEEWDSSDDEGLFFGEMFKSFFHGRMF